jgi:DNA-binding NtrC family response regulator
VLQEGSFERVGDEKSISVDVRIISATNRDLKQEVDRGNFREDLYYRLNVVPIYLPPLRKRKTDIPLLANHFLENGLLEGQRQSSKLSRETLSLMMDYPWPGNIRELQSAIRFALVKSKSNVILPGDLPMELRNMRTPKPRRGPARKLNIDKVRSALKQSGGNKAKAARLLGVGRATLYRFLVDLRTVS